MPHRATETAPDVREKPRGIARSTCRLEWRKGEDADIEAGLTETTVRVRHRSLALLPSARMDLASWDAIREIIESLPTDLGEAMAMRRMRRGESPIKRLLLEALEARQLLAAEFEPNDDAATATPLDFSSNGGWQSVTGRIEETSDVDMFRLQLVQGQDSRDRFSTTCRPTPMASCQRSTCSTNPAGCSRHRAPWATKLSMVAPRTGDYFIRASSAYELGTYLGNYAFPYLVVSSSGQLEAEPNDSIANGKLRRLRLLGQHLLADRWRFRAI